jgi:hypothetical protein
MAQVYQTERHSETQPVTAPTVWTSEVVSYIANDDCVGVRCTYVRIDNGNITRVAARITGDAIGAEQPLRVCAPAFRHGRYVYDDVTATLPKHVATHDEAVAWWLKCLTGGER